MAPLETVDIFLPLSLPAQMVFYQNNKLEPRFGVQDAGNKAIIRANRQKLRMWLATNVRIQFNKVATPSKRAPTALSLCTLKTVPRRRETLSSVPME